MILVNNPGTWSAVYPQLEHAQWDGWTYTDTIFPFFLFIVGVAMALSLGRRRAAGAAPGALARHLAIRAAAIIGLGLVLGLVSFFAFHKEHMRFPGVLQRIGVCVLAAGAIFLFGGARAIAAAAVILLVGYWALMSPGPLDPGTNLAARIDHAVFGAHTWKAGWDPEGLLSTLPAIATTLLGVLAGERLRARGSAASLRGLFAAGAIATAAGLFWGRFFPINKSLWSSSYALLMAGLACLCLAACVWIVDVRGWKRWAAPLAWLGRNAIAAFTLSTLGAITLIAVKLAGPDGKPRSLWTTIYRAVFDRFADPRLGSLLFALVYLSIWVAVFGLLDRKKIFIRL
jgi:predicted acyltransferase